MDKLFRDFQDQRTFHAGREYERKIQAKRIKELEDKIEFAITAIQTGKEHTCPLCKDYLNEAEQALKG